MVEFFSSWAKNLGLAIVIVSILEMLLPNNKNKKYIRVIMGIYVIFTIMSPLVSNKDKLELSSIDLNSYLEAGAPANGTTINEAEEVNQASMDARIKELYIEELEKDITKKLEDKGYKVTSCKVDAELSNEDGESKINKIKLQVEKSQGSQTQSENSIEDKIVTRDSKSKTN